MKSPVQWLIGSVRMLECDLPPTAGQLGHGPATGARFVRTAQCERLGRRGHVDHHEQHCSRDITMRESLVEGTMPQLTPNDLAKKPGGQVCGMKLEKALQRVRLGGVKLDRLLTPEERADKRCDHGVAATPAFPNCARAGPAGSVARIPRFKNDFVGCRCSYRHPADDVHARISSHLKRL